MYFFASVLGILRAEIIHSRCAELCFSIPQQGGFSICSNNGIPLGILKQTETENCVEMSECVG